MTEAIDDPSNGSDNQLGEDGMHHVRSQLAMVLAEMEAEDRRTQDTEPSDDGLPDEGDD